MSKLTMKLHRVLAMIWALSAYPVQAMAQYTAQPQFNLYPAVDPQRLATALGVSSGCLSALNTTVTCDPTLLSMAGTVDNYLWSVDNATTLCTSTCLASARAWYDAVNDGCFDDTGLIVRGKVVPLYTVPGRTLDGLNLVCLTPATNVSADAGVGGTIVAVDNSNSTVSSEDSSGGDIGNDIGDNSVVGHNISSQAWKRKRQTKKRQTKAASTRFCLVDSYAWAGSDIIRPDCSVASNQNHSQCVDPTDVPAENQRLANLYPDSVLCDVCFVNLFYLRLASPYLADLDHSDYLIQQYYDILGVCNITHMPDLLVRERPDYDDAPGFLDGLPINGSSTEQPFASDGGRLANGTCPSRMLTYAQLVQVADGLTNSTTDVDNDVCDALAATFHVATGDLYEAFGNFGCDVSSPNATNATWCIPAACGVYKATGKSCDNVAAASNITTQQLLGYNPHLQGTCDQLDPQYLCVTSPGGAYVPPPSNLTSSGGGERQRGGYGGGGRGTTRKGNPEVTVRAGGSPPMPTQPGIVDGCVRYSNTSAGDGCQDFAAAHKITPAQLYGWNTVLGASGSNCLTEFWVGYYYCIGVASSPSKTESTILSSRTATTVSSKTASPSTLTSPTTSSVPPSPTQDGIAHTCDKYAQAKAGDVCNAFAAAQKITPADLFKWNTVLGVGGADCSTELWAGYYYCVHAS
ncbi:hypothetical protein SEUCBS139899_005763 [Sporothrix eucalyptigena]|uniref:LysM domain-containing protein n=1 Tax=Sporothrix eucalyptigena TaxID=1812306 RepID=A0ABP0BNE5_9PEZI